MPVTRIYVPISATDLEQIVVTGSLSATAQEPRRAYAVTAALVAREPHEDAEGLEYVAFLSAVAGAGAARTAPEHRRVVLAADADTAWFAPTSNGPITEVALTDDVPRSRMASMHVDEDAGVAGTTSDADLLWYDVTEIAEVRDLVAGTG